VVLFGLGMRYYLRVRVGYEFGLINLVLLHSEYLYSFSVEPFVTCGPQNITEYRNNVYRLHLLVTYNIIDLILFIVFETKMKKSYFQSYQYS